MMKQVRILMVDDNENLVEAVKEAFKNSEKIKIVLEAHDGREGFELIKTIDDPPINDLFYHELPEKEMMKEVDYNMSEGILPDAGDINYDIVQKIMNMEDDEEKNIENDNENNSDSEK